MEPQPRRYRVRIFDRDRELLGDRQYMAVLDLTSGPSLRAAEGQLDALVQALAYAAGLRGERVLGCHLVVADWDTGKKHCDWPAKTFPDSTY